MKSKIFSDDWLNEQLGYSGNITADQLDKEREEGISHRDRYKCDCGRVVFEEDWSKKYRRCTDCFLDMLEDKQIK